MDKYTVLQVNSLYEQVKDAELQVPNRVEQVKARQAEINYISSK